MTRYYREEIHPGSVNDTRHSPGVLMTRYNNVEILLG